MTRFSALALTLLVAACPGGGGTTTASTDDGTSSTSTSGSSSSASTTSTTTSTSSPTTTAAPTTSDASTSTSTTEPAGSSSTDPSTTTDASTSSTTDASTGSSSGGSSGGSTGMPVDPVCGDSKTEGDEACDDGNTKTELSKSTQPPLMYDASQCIDDCSLVLSKCGNKTVDPGEVCDDGNTDSSDACTTSCITNDKAVHSPCKRTCKLQDNCDTNIAGGIIMGCDNLQVPNGAQKICFDSTQSVVAKRYFAEGECLAAAQSCSGGPLCPPNVGDVTKLTNCPNGTTLITNVTMTFGLTVTTKVCHKTCVSDAECRWNAYDSVWKKPGQIRCQTTPDSNGVKICADAQNN